MSRETRSTKEERMRHVVETARSLFIDQGYSATSTSQIARKAGVVEMTLFRYFPTKKELFEAVIAPLITFDWFPLESIEEGASPKSEIIALLHKRVEFAKQNRELVRLLVIESHYQPDLTNDLNPLEKASGQLRQLLVKLGIGEGASLTVLNLIMGLILTIAFTPHFNENSIDTTLGHIEAQLSTLLDQAYEPTSVH